MIGGLFELINREEFMGSKHLEAAASRGPRCSSRGTHATLSLTRGPTLAAPPSLAVAPIAGFGAGRARTEMDQEQTAGSVVYRTARTRTEPECGHRWLELLLC